MEELLNVLGIVDSKNFALTIPTAKMSRIADAHQKLTMIN